MFLFVLASRGWTVSAGTGSVGDVNPRLQNANNDFPGGKAERFRRGRKRWEWSIYGFPLPLWLLLMLFVSKEPRVIVDTRVQTAAGGSSSGKNVRFFSYNELMSATGNFHWGNKIGRGGFGTVYKGTLKSGKQVAVKVLGAESKQGVGEFLTEIDTITNVRHLNLVALVGCCIQGNHRILVYDYAENGSLDRALLRSETSKLDWSRRSAICLGTARGLMFLHEELEPPIVHRDIKASNILLDKNFIPKIGDFGLAKLFPDNVTHISTRVAGTIGYLAPEYALGGRLTKKADIYSFGVLVLEIVSGRSSAKSSWTGTEKFLLEWTWQLYKEGRLLELVDANLVEYPEEEVLRHIKVALFCTQEAVNRRPSMLQVVEMLSKPLRLHETELTPPGLTRSTGTSGDLKVINSTNSPMKSSSSTSSIIAVSSVSVGSSEIIPR
ncbi:hypothetical protein Taro_035774 [Colocasia esculenta]|uniref:Protein kinase domain-containing protein n=1 Tax=Colocasia esculenta TaxID=4460 RepID=A0A843W7N4_COLES|nr:hypothetical protein [Colocasia esculenta]